MRQRIGTPGFLSGRFLSGRFLSGVFASSGFWLGSLAVSAMLLLGATSRLMGKNGIVHTTDGKALEGDIAETADGVTISIRGIQTNLPRETVASIEYPANIEQQYKERVAKLGKTDAKGHLDLAKWLLDKKSYSLAAQEVDAAQRIDPSSGEAVTLYQVILSQRRLEASAHAGPTVTTPRMTPDATGRPATGMPANVVNRKYLSADDVNLIKQSEWKATDATVRVRMQGDVIKRYTSYASVNPAEFKSGLTDQQRAWEILTRGLPEMRSEVRLLNDPQPLAEYRTKIQPVLLNGCATANCHGGASAPGGFFLYNPAENEAATYTNFYLLNRFSSKAGKVIDRAYPDKSLVCQYALPAVATDVQHPEVPKGTAWRGIAMGKEDARYKMILNWVRESLVAVEPKYNINFTLEGGSKPPAAPAP